MAQDSENKLLRQLLETLETRVGPQRIIRDSDMFAVCGLKRSQRDELIARGEFPAPIRLAGLGGRAKGWIASEIAEWQRRRLAERDESKP